MKRPLGRPPFNFSKSLQQRLNMYGLAASAAGVGLLALAQPSEAKIVHHQIGVALEGNENYPFNPAHQAVAPFSVVGSFINRSSEWWNRVWLRPNTQYAGALLAKNQFVGDLHAGEVIGQRRPFGEGAASGLLFTYGPYGGGTLKHHKGNFTFGHSDYVGFKFNIAGKPHFGWLRMRVSIHAFPGEKMTVAHLRDFAYETVPGKSIKAGQTNNAEDTSDEASNASLAAPAHAPAALGMLALGAPALSIWRREDS